MSCEGAAIPFQAHANNGIWSIDFVPEFEIVMVLSFYSLIFPILRQSNLITSILLVKNY